MKRNIKKKKAKGDANSTRCSQAVTHPSTDRARRCLTSVIRREPVFSTWYGRWREGSDFLALDSSSMKLYWQDIFQSSREAAVRRSMYVCQLKMFYSSLSIYLKVGNVQLKHATILVLVKWALLKKKQRKKAEGDRQLEKVYMSSKNKNQGG